MEMIQRSINGNISHSNSIWEKCDKINRKTDALICLNKIPAHETSNWRIKTQILISHLSAWSLTIYLKVMTEQAKLTDAKLLLTFVNLLKFTTVADLGLLLLRCFYFPGFLDSELG